MKDPKAAWGPAGTGQKGAMEHLEWGARGGAALKDSSGLQLEDSGKEREGRGWGGASVQEGGA